MSAGEVTGAAARLPAAGRLQRRGARAALAALAVAGLACAAHAPSRSAVASPRGADEVHLAVVACGDRLDETLVMLRSAVLLARGHVTAHVFADDALRPRFAERVAAWPRTARSGLTLRTYPISYPGIADPRPWLEPAKPCAAQRLFLPDLVRDTDRVIYVDTDVLFLRPIDDAWRLFDRFAPEQLAALVPEDEVPQTSWYKRFARHPYYAPYGLNTGFMLMDLGKMRARRWRERLAEIVARHAGETVWVDQDLQNILFHDAPEELLPLSCDWNYRPDHCRYASTCRAAEQSGVGVLHGSRRAFHGEKEPAFRSVYDVFARAEPGPDAAARLAAGVRAALAALPRGESACTEVKDLFGVRLAAAAARPTIPARAAAAERVDEGFYDDVARDQLAPWRERGIGSRDLARIRATGRPVVRYQIIDHRLYRDRACAFPARCRGIEHFLHEVAPDLPDVELLINVQDHPVSGAGDPLPVLSFSKQPRLHADILYPAWAFWEGGPALAVVPTWRWDLMRRELLDEGTRVPWCEKRPAAFFRGSRTSAMRDPLVRHAAAADARWDVRYTLNQSQRETQVVTEVLKLDPARPVPPREHCAYRYLVHFDGVAASFRLKMLLACGSTVLYVQPQWVEFFYPKLVPWQHYVPLPLDVGDADATLDMLRTNDVLARQIAASGRAFVEEHLTLGDVTRYWRTLLREYAALQRFHPERDPALVPVESGDD